MNRSENSTREEKNMAASVQTSSSRRKLPWRVKLTLVACFLLEFTAGIQYTFGNLLPYMTSYLRVSVGLTSVDYNSAMWVGECSRMTFSIVMPLLGLVLPRLPPRLHFVLGFLAFAVNLFGSYWAVQQSLPALIVFYGVCQGIGKALIYPSGVSLALRWVPWRKGLVGGVVMAGYGGGALVWNQVVTNWINPDNLQADLKVQHDVYFTQPEVLSRVPTCFLFLGGIMGGIQLLSIAVLTFPPPPHATLDVDDTQQSDQLSDNSKSDSSIQLETLPKPDPLGKEVPQCCPGDPQKPNDLSEKGCSSDPSGLGPSGGEEDCRTLQQGEGKSINAESLAKTGMQPAGTETAGNNGVNSSVSALNREESERKERQPIEAQQAVDYTPFDLLRSRAAWTVCLAYFATELTIIFVADLHKAYAQTFIPDDHYLAVIASCTAIFNSMGRPVWGGLADRFGFLPTLLSTQALLCLAAATFLTAETLGDGRVAYAVWVFAMYWAISGVFSLQPSLTFALFGPSHFTANLGMIRVTGVVSSLLSVFVASAAKEAFGYHGIFLVGAACTGAGMLISATFLLTCGCHLPPHVSRVLFRGRQTKDDVIRHTDDVSEDHDDAGQETSTGSQHPSSDKPTSQTSA